MTPTRRAVQNDVLDKIVYDHYGNSPGALAHVLAANPKLRHEDAVLASGQLVYLPDYSPEPADTKVRLWS